MRDPLAGKQLLFPSPQRLLGRFRLCRLFALATSPAQEISSNYHLHPIGFVMVWAYRPYQAVGWPLLPFCLN